MGNEPSATKWGDGLRVWGVGWWANVENGEIAATSSDGYPFHAPTAEERAQALAAVESSIMPPTDAEPFIRFGELPEHGRSTNWAAGEEERGVSVYDAYWRYDVGAYGICGNGLAGGAIWYTLAGAPVYLVTGSEIGIGSDGEPVIENAEVLFELERNENGYVPKRR